MLSTSSATGAPLAPRCCILACRAALLCLILSALAAPSPAAAQDPVSISAALQSAASLPVSQSFRVSLFLLNATGLLAKLPSLAPLTLFAPTDAAWRAAFKALAMPDIESYIFLLTFEGLGGGGGVSLGNLGTAGGDGSGTPQPMPPAVSSATAGGGAVAMASIAEGASSSELPSVDTTLPGGTNASNGTMQAVDYAILDGFIPLSPLVAGLNAIFAGDCSPAAWEKLTAERPDAAPALADLLSYHVATVALNAAAIATQFTDAAGNLTTVNGQPLWVDYNVKEAAVELCAYSPQQRALIAQGISVDSEGNAYYLNGTVISLDGTVISERARMIGTDSDGNMYYSDGLVVYANGTMTDANGTMIDANGTMTDANGTMIDANGTVISNVAAIDSSGILAPPAVVTSQIGPPQVDLTVSGDITTGGMNEGMGNSGGGTGNLSANEAQLWEMVERWMAQALPGLKLTHNEYASWRNTTYPDYSENSTSAVWQQRPGSSENVARVVSADLMDAAGIVVHGIDGVLFPIIPSYDGAYLRESTEMGGNGSSDANGMNCPYQPISSSGVNGTTPGANQTVKAEGAVAAAEGGGGSSSGASEASSSDSGGSSSGGAAWGAGRAAVPQGKAAGAGFVRGHLGVLAVWFLTIASVTIFIAF